MAEHKSFKRFVFSDDIKYVKGKTLLSVNCQNALKPGPILKLSRIFICFDFWSMKIFTGGFPKRKDKKW